MPKRIICLLFITLALTLAHSTALSQDSISVSPISPVYCPLEQGPEDIQRAFIAMVNAFALYSSLLEDTDSPSGYLISRHADNTEEAIEFLDRGFTPSLAKNIVESYMQYVPEMQKLMVIPSDGIPILTQADYNECVYCQTQFNRIVFQRSYSGCYSEHDSFLFIVNLSRFDSSWKIAKLELLECGDAP